MDKVKQKIRELAEAVGLKVMDEEEPQLESWHVEDGGNCQLTGQHCDLVSNKAGNLIAYVVAKYAKQVAALPDLLEAAKAIMDNCHSYYNAGSTERGHFHLSMEDKLKLKEAVAKAEGEIK